MRCMGLGPFGPFETPRRFLRPTETENARGPEGFRDCPFFRKNSAEGPAGRSDYSPRVAPTVSRPRYSKSMLTSLVSSSMSSSSVFSSVRPPIAQAGTAARAWRTMAAEALGSVPSSERTASKSRGRPQISARRPAHGRPVCLEDRSPERARREVHLADDLEEVGVADAVEQAHCVSAFTADAEALGVAPGGDRRGEARSPDRRAAGSLAGRDGKSLEESRSISTVAARAPIRSSASGTVPTEFSRSTERELARMRRSSVRY